MKNKTIAICGAGIAGVAAAYYLSKKRSGWKIILLDKNQPLSFTTSKSGENFRDYWPTECMAQFCSDSIDLMEGLSAQHGRDSFEMNYSGYNFISHHKTRAIFAKSDFGNFKNNISEITDTRIIQKEQPYLDKSIQKIVTIKKAGKIDVYAMGSLLLREAKKRDVTFVQGEILSVHKKESKFEITLATNKTIKVDKVVIAAGPFINHLADMMGFSFPISNTLQRKFIIPDPKNIIPKNMPFTIYADPQYLKWTDEEVDFFTAEKSMQWLLNEFPGGLHIKPETGGCIKLGWAFQRTVERPSWEIPNFDFFPQVVLKGASRFIPQLKVYENEIPTPLIEYAGYYTRTAENWPLIGPTEIQNVYVIGALAGFGTMTACAAGALCADYVFDKKELPDYAAYFHPNRYNNPTILSEIDKLESDGQL